jgi:hypothetical protein
MLAAIGTVSEPIHPKRSTPECAFTGSPRSSVGISLEERFAEPARLTSAANGQPGG